MRRLLCLLFLLLTGPITIPDLQAPAVAAVSTIASPARAQAQPAPAADLERRNLILETRDELRDAADSRLEIILGGLGVLMTVVVLFFAINTKDAAVKVAKGEMMEAHEKFRVIEQEAMQSVANLRRELDEARGERERLTGELAAASERTAAIESEFQRVADTVNKQIEEVFSRLAHTERSIRASQQRAEAVSEALERKAATQSGAALPQPIATSEEDGKPLGEKDAKDLSENDFSVLIGNAASDGNYQEVYELAVTMRRLIPQSSAQTYALFAEGWALDQLDREADALAVYAQAADRFAGESDTLTRLWAAKAWLNRNVMLGRLGRQAEGIASLDAMIDALSDSEEDDLKAELARALVQKGYQLEQINESADAQAVFDGVVARFGASDDFSIRHQVSFALYELAAIAGANGDATEAAALLRKWGEKRGDFDPEWAASDARFDPVRADPAVVALLAEEESDSAESEAQA